MKKTIMKTPSDQSGPLLTLIIHAIILVSTAIVAVSGILYGSSGSDAGDHLIGLGYFKAFTMDCNVAAGICAFFVVCFAIKSLLKKENAMPGWVVIFQYMTATSLLLTIVAVAFILAPMDAMEGTSYFGMFSNDFFLYHLINPALAVFSFVFLQKNYRLERKDCMWGVLPVAVYVIVYILMVAVFRKWDDFYGFSFGGRYYLAPAVILIILALTYAAGYLLIWMNGKILGRRAARK